MLEFGLSDHFAEAVSEIAFIEQSYVDTTRTNTCPSQRIRTTSTRMELSAVRKTQRSFMRDPRISLSPSAVMEEDGAVSCLARQANIRE